ncbi:hypothetical protein ABQ433_00720 [Citrobacter freundii]|uniref:hypothetical protein n=1 Tax=Citrobacter freundii TaxID=546 RepID=UPI003AAD33A8
MSLEETKSRLLNASETAEDLLATVSDLYVQELHSNETSLAVALSELHNSGVIDIVKTVRGVDKSSCGRSFFTILHAFENALPSLDARIEDVLHCLVHLTQQAGRDSAIGGIYKAFEQYCSAEAHRPRDSVGFILAQSELNAYAPFLSSSILAYGSGCVMEAIQTTENLIANSNEMVRNQAYFALGRLAVDETKANAIWELIRGNAVSENDNDCCASILRATLHFGETFPSYWPYIEEFLITFVKMESTEVLYIISNIIAFQRLDLPESVLHLIVKQLANVSSEQKGIIDNIDHILVKLVEEGKSTLAVELLESILTAGITLNSLDYFSNELVNKYQELRNHIITKWLLYGEAPLCRSILDLLHDTTCKDIELKAEMALLDNEMKQVFVSRKVIGWLFTRPIETASFILSISETASTNIIKTLENILYYPLLLSYPGELKRFFQSCIDNGIQEHLCERLLEKYKSYHTDIEKVSEINELKAPNENLRVYWKNVDKSMQEAHEEASKFSFFRMFTKTKILLYGNSSIYYMHQGDGKSVRQEMQMQTFSHSTEMPRLNVLDPVSLDHFLIQCRCERMKNEINS